MSSITCILLQKTSLSHHIRSNANNNMLTPEITVAFGIFLNELVIIYFFVANNHRLTLEITVMFRIFLSELVIIFLLLAVLTNKQNTFFIPPAIYTSKRLTQLTLQ
jgi:hypothetical protein